MPAPTLSALSCKVKELTTQVNSLELVVNTLRAAVEATPPFYLGEVALVAGTVTVADINVTAETLIMLSRHTLSGTAGALSYTLNPGVGFTITSSAGTDAGVIVYQVFN